MITILHISDLHIIEGAQWNNMYAALLNEVREKVHDQQDGEKLMVITGDFHNFSDDGYQKAKKVLKELFEAMAIDPAQDVFIIPGNHDVANESAMRDIYRSDKDWKKRQKSALSGLKNGDKDFLDWRLESFVPYCEFAQEIGIYPKDSEILPAQVHVRNWRQKLNILHLNTALVADGTEKDNQQADTDKATAEATWKDYFEDTVPVLAIGHNSFFDLAKEQQTELEAVFERKNVSAYLCGDQHRTEKNRNMQMIRLKSGHMIVPEIPNIICMKSVADKSDAYSEFGFYWHEWDEETDKVDLYARNWKRDEDQSEFVPLGQNGCYSMRRKKEKVKQNDIILDNIPKDLSAKSQKAPLVNGEKGEQKLIHAKQAVQNAYFEYLAKELGIIQFDGIPTDKESGTVKAELENVFVPLEFYHIAGEGQEEEQTNENVTMGEILCRSSRAAILAKPGGGKSTLIRRIALAYAYPERKIKVDDDLPNQRWFPVYIRCRDLGENVQNSIMDNIFSIINRAELSQYRQAFAELIEECIQKNEILLLIDGLDEISNEQYRIRFVDQLQTFVQTYPGVHLLITSRETGFRAVASKLSDYCEQYVIADMDNDRIRRLSENWHETLLDNSRQAKEDSDSVCKIILRDSRITALARNPLLLTTLLFVKRWIGYLPTKKCQLYQEMIKLLLVSWNAAAHLRMEMDETEPQLAFVAYEMTKKGKQTIQKPELMQCIFDARNALPELLNYTTVSPAKFINQVEDRSSILIQQGMEEDEKGNLVPSYEFSHLSFQEYLAAKAISENWIPRKEQKESIFLSILKEHLDENQWREVVPLTAVLLKRQAKPAIEYLFEECKGKPARELPEKERDRKSIAAFHLANCIAAEIPLIPQILDKVLLTIANHSYDIQSINIQSAEENIDVFKTIYHSEKYGKNLKNVVENQLFDNKKTRCFSGISNVWIKIYHEEKGDFNLETVVQLLKGVERRKRISGALLMMDWVFTSRRREKFSLKKERKMYNEIFPLIPDLLNETDMGECFAASWCIAWAGYNQRNIIPDNCIPTIVERLIPLWCTVSDVYDVRRVLSWAICSISQRGLKIESNIEIERAISIYTEHPETEFDKTAAIYMQLLLGKITVNNIKKKDLYGMFVDSRFIKEMGYKDL